MQSPLSHQQQLAQIRPVIGFRYCSHMICQSAKKKKLAAMILETWKLQVIH